VTFAPGACYNVEPFYFPTASLSSFGCGTSGNVSILFGDNVTDAALALQSNWEINTFSSYLNGVLVETFDTLTFLSSLPDLSNASNFYGFTGSLFNELRISNGSGVFQIDNLQMLAATNVPEPSTLALLGLGLTGIGFARRKKLAA
jgi:hypothetical protein